MKLLAFYTLALFVLQQIIGSYSDTRVSVVGTNDSFVIETFGEQRTLISDEDAKKWDLSPESLCKSAVGQYFGKNPNDCYLHEPTPWKLYPTYGWSEITSVYKPISSRYIERTSNPVALLTRSYINKQDFPITVTLELAQSVTDTVTHRTSNENTIGTSGSASWSMWVVEASVEMNYEHTWGNEETVEKSKTVSITDTVTAEIPPHTNLTFTLAAYNIKAKFEVVCSNSLEGYVATNYNPKYKDHHFWALSTRILQPTKNPRQITETITFDFFSDGYLEASRLDLNNQSAVPVSVPLSDVINPLVLHAD